jgi:hypothetical protein
MLPSVPAPMRRRRRTASWDRLCRASATGCLTAAMVGICLLPLPLPSPQPDQFRRPLMAVFFAALPVFQEPTMPFPKAAVIVSAIGAAFLGLSMPTSAFAQSPCSTPGTCTCVQMAADCKNYYPADVCKKADQFCLGACRNSGGKTASFVGPASGATRVARCR